MYYSIWKNTKISGDTQSPPDPKAGTLTRYNAKYIFGVVMPHLIKNPYFHHCRTTDQSNPKLNACNSIIGWFFVQRLLHIPEIPIIEIDTHTNRNFGNNAIQHVVCAKRNVSVHIPEGFYSNKAATNHVTIKFLTNKYSILFS